MNSLPPHPFSPPPPSSTPPYIYSHLPRIRIHKPPSPQRQSLQLQRRGTDIAPKSHHADDDAKDIGDVIPIPGDIARARAGEAAGLLRFEDAGKGRGDEVAFEGREVFGRFEGRVAGGEGEVVDEFEDEEAGEGAAEVGDAVGRGRRVSWWDFRKGPWRCI